jgi:uncharacterized integral membrane protein (TIGR00698 family)
MPRMPPAPAAALAANAAGDAPVRASLWPGLLLSAVIAVAAMQLGHWLPLIGGPVFAIVLGVAVRNLAAPPAACRPGIRFAGKQVLQWSIVALGLGLSLTQVVRTGLESLSVTLVTVAVAFVAAWLLGRALGVSSKLKLLIGVGTAICGGSAIAAVTPIVKADEHDTGFAISTIFLFNLIAVLVFPLLGHWLGLSDRGFGLWAGTAINDTSSVVAAGYSYSNAAGDFATIVKLTRATLILPVCMGLVLFEAWRYKQSDGFNLRRVFPWFIAWFAVASAVRTAGWIPAHWQAPLHHAAGFLIVVALAAIGLSSDLKRMAATDLRPIALGLGVWVAVAASSLAVQFALGQL